MIAPRFPRGARGALWCCCTFVVLGGCAHHSACTKPEVYEHTTSGPPLRVPPDLSTPPENNSYDVPPAEPVVVEAPPCGHYPPKITSTAKQQATTSSATAKSTAPAATPQTQPAAPATPPAPPSIALQPPPAAPAPASLPTVSPELQSELRNFVVAWAESWSSGNFEQYLQYYAQDFDPPGDLSIEEWQTARRGKLGKGGSLTVVPETLQVTEAAEDRVVVQFVQTSQLEGVTSTLRKGLVLVRENGAWRIKQETVVDVLPNPR